MDLIALMAVSFIKLDKQNGQFKISLSKLGKGIFLGLNMV